MVLLSVVCPVNVTRVIFTTTCSGAVTSTAGWEFSAGELPSLSVFSVVFSSANLHSNGCEQVTKTHVTHDANVMYWKHVENHYFQCPMFPMLKLVRLLKH